MAEQTIVVDNGSGTIFAGFAGEDDPLSVYPTLSGSGGGRQKPSVNFIDLSTSEGYSKFTEESQGGDLKVTYPMEHGIIQDWDSMEAIWDYTFSNALQVNPAEHNLLITEPILNPKTNREKMAQILFEKFNFPAINISQSGILPLYSAGQTTGIVLDIGDGVTQAVPVWGGYPIKEGMLKIDMGGRDVTRLLNNFIREKGSGLKPLEICRLIKEKASYVAIDLNEELSSKSDPTSFELPDGEILKLGDERFRCSELLFNPSYIEDSDKPGVHTMLHRSIMKTNMDIRKDLYGKIVLSGGSTMIPGFVERLTKEITNLVPPRAKINIIANPTRKYATYQGASVLASLTSFSTLLIAKREFEEAGPSIMHKLL